MRCSASWTSNCCARQNSTWQVPEVGQYRKSTAHPSQRQADYCHNLRNWCITEHPHSIAIEHAAWFGKSCVSSASLQRRFITALIYSLRLFLLSIKESPQLASDVQVSQPGLCSLLSTTLSGKNRLKKMSFQLTYVRHVLGSPFPPPIIKRKQ